MVEVYAYPMRKEAARIWKCLDYIFEIPNHLAPKQKAELVLTDLRDRMEIYHQMRRVRVSAQMENRMNKNNATGQGERLGIIDALGQMPQNSASSAASVADRGAMPPANYSPPPVQTDSTSNTSGSRHGSVAGPAAQDVQMGPTMEDIDWVSEDHYHP